MKGEAKRATLFRDCLEGGNKAALNLLLMVTGQDGWILDGRNKF
jgi:hypothetical protein